FHFTRSGVDAVANVDVSPANGIPDYVDDAMEGIRIGYEAYVTQGGWPAAPPDQGVGGDDRIDIYIKRTTRPEAPAVSSCGPNDTYPSFLFGITHAENPVPGTTDSWTSYVILNPSNDVPLGRNFAQSVAAHELHHTLQFGMDTNEPYWVYEATASYFQL